MNYHSSTNLIIVKATSDVEFPIKKRDFEFTYFVGNLAWRTNNNQTLGEAFAPFRKAVNSKIICDRDTGKSRGFGFVTFTNEKSLKDAIWKMDGSIRLSLRLRASDYGGQLE
ncbi:hypothetical protein Leryth_020598 [Lithospermum erythrorhizon]|nr:hypothetical protein Leryth_020598 [Lithospermum erythrorhizon]